MKGQPPSLLGAAGAVAALSAVGSALHAVLPTLIDSFGPILVVAAMAAGGGGLAGALAGRLRAQPTASGAALVLGVVSSFLILGVRHWSGGPVLAALAGVFTGLAYLALRRLPVTWAPRPTCLILVVLCLVCHGVSIARGAAPDRTDGGPRLVVVGVDGATFNVLDSLMAAGRAPNFARLDREGRSGNLMSLPWMMSPRVWTSIATGLPAAEHGIEGFGEVQNEHLKAPRVWDVLARAGKPSLLFGWLVTWPPDRLPGASIVVPGWMARSPATRPSSLNFLKVTELSFQKGSGLPLLTMAAYGLRSLAHGVSLGTLMGTAAEILSMKAGPHRGDAVHAYARNKILQMRTNADLFLALRRTEDFPWATITFFGSDALSHKYWKYREPEKYGIDPTEAAALGGVIDEYYEGVDDFLGRLMQEIDERTTLFVLSDHGFTGADAGSFESRFTVRTKAFEQATAIEGISVFAVANQIVVRAPVGTAALVEALRAFRMAETGIPLLSVEIDGQGVRAETNGHLFTSGSESLRLLDEMVETPAGAVRAGSLLMADTRSGIHQSEGVVFAWGRGIATGGRSEHAYDVLNLAPTWLRLLGLPVDPAMREPMLDWMTPEMRAAAERGPVADLGKGFAEWRTSVATDSRAIVDVDSMLEDLGYVGEEEE